MYIYPTSYCHNPSMYGSQVFSSNQFSCHKQLHEDNTSKTFFLRTIALSFQIYLLAATGFFLNCLCFWSFQNVASAKTKWLIFTLGGGISSESLEKRSLIENGDFEDSIVPWRSQGILYYDNSHDNDETMMIRQVADYVDDDKTDHLIGCLWW